MPTLIRKHYRAAIIGFTAAYVAYQHATNMQSPASLETTLVIASLIVCPPSLLSIPFIDAEVGTSAFYFLWSVIALLNAALYAAAAAAISALRKNRPRA